MVRVHPLQGSEENGLCASEQRFDHGYRVAGKRASDMASHANTAANEEADRKTAKGSSLKKRFLRDSASQACSKVLGSAIIDITSLISQSTSYSTATTVCKIMYPMN